MKIYLIFSLILLVSCNTIKLDYKVEENEKWKYDLIESILNNPKAIINICDDTSLVTEKFQKKFYKTEKYYFLLDIINESDFSENAIITYDKKDKKGIIDFHLIETKLSLQDPLEIPYLISFTFYLINGYWKLNIIQFELDLLL
jgi:hypothetical protein